MEHDKFYMGSSLSEYSQALLNENFTENEFIIRVGRHSGVESVTLDEYRNPQPPGKVKSWGNTRNIADGFYPMGWIKMRYEEL